MTNAPSTRQTHIIRIVGANRNGDVLQDIWADVERVDVAKSASQAPGSQWQGVQRKLLWMDDPAADDDNPDGTGENLRSAIQKIRPTSTIRTSEYLPDHQIHAFPVKRCRDAGPAAQQGAR